MGGKLWPLISSGAHFKCSNTTNSYVAGFYHHNKERNAWLMDSQLEPYEIFNKSGSIINISGEGERAKRFSILCLFPNSSRNKKCQLASRGDNERKSFNGSSRQWLDFLSEVIWMFFVVPNPLKRDSVPSSREGFFVACYLQTVLIFHFAYLGRFIKFCGVVAAWFIKTSFYIFTIPRRTRLGILVASVRNEKGTAFCFKPRQIKVINSVASEREGRNMTEPKASLPLIHCCFPFRFI